MLLALVLLGGCDEPRASNTPAAREPLSQRPAPPNATVERIDAALARAAAFLRGKQGADGAFRSQLYAALRDGYSLSPLALTVLRITAGHDGRAYGRGVDFVASLVQSGRVRENGQAPHYPLYALAGAALVLNVDDNRRHDPQRAVILRALAARQLDEARGYAESDPSYGGFSYSNALQVPRHDRSAADRDHAGNLSATLFAIGALRLAGLAPEGVVLRKARTFVLRCQNFGERSEQADPQHDDGGFFFSPAVADPNKAGSAGRGRDGRLRHRSYGSMTADGLRALLQLGLPLDSPRVRAAAAWLERHFDPAQNPGAFPENAEVRRASAYYYYSWSVAHALRGLGKPKLETERGTVAWASALAEALLARQGADGSFRNAYSEMREDDPLVATPLAAAALAVARSTLAGEYRSHRRGVTPPR